MFNKISQEMKKMLVNFSDDDKIIFNGQQIEVDKSYFSTISEYGLSKSVAFVDGGQAEIFSTGNFCLSFIRVFGQVFLNNVKKKSYLHEFYLFTKAKWVEEELVYESKMYLVDENEERLVNEQDLLVSSNDATLRVGNERAPISKVTNMARRFAELALAKKISAEYIVLDGTLEPTFNNEQKYIATLAESEGDVCALAKSSSLFTTSGNSPVVLLNKIGPISLCWNYFLNDKTRFVKLNQKAKHVFRFEGTINALPHLVQNSSDALFLGYPYGLLFVDRMARVSNNEKSSLKARFLLKKENKELANYLNTNNAHDILDNLG